MLNINKINNKLPLLINSVSSLKGDSIDRVRVKINKKLIDSSPQGGGITNVIQKTDFIINDPKTLTEKYNVLNKSVNLLNSIKENSDKTNNSLIKQIIKQKITDATNNNILKSVILRNIKLTYIKDKKSLPSFFVDNRKKTIFIDSNDKLNQIRINKNYYISYKHSNNLCYKSNNLNSLFLLHVISYNKLNELNNNIIVSENSINNKEIVNNNNNNLLSNSIIKLIKSSNSTDKNKMLRSNTNLNVNLSSDNNKSESDIKNIYLINSLRRFTNIMTKFSPSIANSQTIFYHFKKSNKVITYPFIYASKIIILTFLSMGCLISRPVFKIVYTKQRNRLNEDFKVEGNKKIIIQLFYYVKYRSNFSSFRNLLLKLFANPDIMAQDYKVNSYLNNADKINLKSNNTINKTELIRTLTQIKKFNNSKGFFARFPNKFQSLAMYLTNLFGSEVQLDLIRLYKPHFDSNILVQNLNLKSYDNRFFGVVTNLFNNTYIKHRLTKMVKESEPDEKTFRALTPLSNAYLTGVKVRLGGRSFQQRIVARQTVQEIQRGSLSNTQYKFKQTARFTGKVKRGSYSFTVTLGHTF